MRLLLTVLAGGVFCGVAFGQTVAGPEQVIRRIIDSGGYEGHDAKILDRMGDAAAVAVTKVVGGKNLSPNDVPRLLLILRISFADLALVEVVSDREPRTSLFILRYLDSLTHDRELKKTIADTKTYIQEQYEKSKKQDEKKK